MLETVGVALTTFFATIGPLEAAAIFAALTTKETIRQRRLMAIRGTLIATIILVVFALMGDLLLASLGISLAALRVSGGILLLIIAIDMVFARSPGGVSTMREGEWGVEMERDISVFPIATPLIAGPAAMGAVILLMANAEGDFARQATVLVALLVILFFTAIALLLASKIQQLLGVIGANVINRIMGVLLSALAIQFIFDGIKQSGLLG